MITKRNVEINDLPKDYAQNISQEEQAKIAGGYRVTFSDVLISSYQTGGSAGGDSVPLDSFSLNFAKIPTT